MFSNIAELYLIEYVENSEEWKDVLRNKIEYLINSKNELKGNNDLQYDFDVAIITAINKELDKILRLDGKWSEKKLYNDSTQYHIGQFKRDDGKIVRVVAACAPQMGMCASSTLSMKLITNFKPEYLMMSGIAAGIAGEVELGDILVAEQVWDGASGKLRGDGKKGIFFQPDPRSKVLNEDIKEKILNIQAKRKYLDEIRSQYPGDAPKTVLNLHIGPMASVPAVIQSNEEIEKIKSISRKLIGIEMETYGVFYSASHCQKPKPNVISVKSVCDFANEEKNDSFQDYAAYTSAALIHKLILHELDFDNKKY
jgi:nucleoside phosphorylase